MVAGWTGDLDRESVPAAIYITWRGDFADQARDAETAADRQAAIEEGLGAAIQELTGELGSDWTQWRYGKINTSELPHAFARAFDLPQVERGGANGSLNANGANFRRIIDLSNIDNSVWTNAPGQSAQPESPFYGNTRESLGNGEYMPVLFSRDAVERGAAHRLTLLPGM